MEKENRPWGSFTVLHEEPGFKVKILEVIPGKRLSYQRHAHRSERWTVVQGRATVVIDGVTGSYPEGGIVVVEKRTKHRLENQGIKLLKVVEVQFGDYLGEDDIERFEDDFGRA